MANCSLRPHRGYTYFGVLFVVALVGLALAGAAMVWKIQQQREKERELLFVGQQYIDAIASYYHAAPGGAKKYPRSIEELLRDPRYPTLKRHLRKPWRDPLTGSSSWQLVLTQQGGIAGIHSNGNGVPLKQAGFGSLEKLLSGKSSYRDWKFIYIAAVDDNPIAPQEAQPTSTEDGDSDIQESVDEDETAEEETGEEFLIEEKTNAEAN